MKKNTNHSDDTKSFKENLNDTAKNVEKTFSAATDKAKTVVTKSKDSIVNVVDANGNGESTLKILLLLVYRPPALK